MNKEQQDKLWNDLSEESKKYVLKNYQENKDIRDKIENWIRREYETLFGSHNLNPEPQIKTWEDVEKECPNIKSETDTLNYHISTCIAFDFEIDKKLIATYKIAKLIDLGYGGMVSEEEWEDDNIRKYCVIIDNGKIDKAFDMITIKQFIAFHTPEQREEFMSHESNRRLVEQYFLI